jgi:hypothetical protein
MSRIIDLEEIYEDPKQEPDPDPKPTEKYDPDPKEIIPGPQHCLTANKKNFHRRLSRF